MFIGLNSDHRIYETISHLNVEVGFLLLIGSADTSARLRVGDQLTRYLVETLGDRSTHVLVDLDT